MSGTDPNAPPEATHETNAPPPAEGVPAGAEQPPAAEQQVSEVPDPSIPPARTAQTAGEYVAPTSYNDFALGRPTDAVGGPAAPPMPPPIMDLAATPAANLNPESAQSRAQAMIGTLSQWLMMNPHPLTGEAAVVSNFMRELTTRRMNRATGLELGREDEPDAVDTAKSEGPPPEYHQLADMADEVLRFCDELHTWTEGHGYELSDDLQRVASDLISKAQAVAQQTPAVKPEEPAPQPEPVPEPAPETQPAPA